MKFNFKQEIETSCDRIFSWLAEKESKLPQLLYSSVDLRESTLKLLVLIPIYFQLVLIIYVGQYRIHL